MVKASCGGRCVGFVLGCFVSCLCRVRVPFSVCRVFFFSLFFGNDERVLKYMNFFKTK